MTANVAPSAHIRCKNGSRNGEVFRPLSGNTFRFNCHKAIPCFTNCCARLRLILTPFDILRMKTRLALSSDLFLESHTDTIMDDSCSFPLVKLRMNEDEKETCPFLTTEGCGIYSDRPAACRLYPIGRASTLVAGEPEAREKFFVISESHCLGFEEERHWTLEEWLAHEGMKDYNTMNEGWIEIITSSRSLGEGKDAARKLQMFFMASYNVDRFRNFIFQSRFFELFSVKPEVKAGLFQDDVQLMQFAFKWLKFALFGERTIPMKATDRPE